MAPPCDIFNLYSLCLETICLIRIFGKPIKPFSLANGARVVGLRGFPLSNSFCNIDLLYVYPSDAINGSSNNARVTGSIK